MHYEWKQVNQLKSKRYKCGYCDNDIASEKGWDASLTEVGGIIGHIRICHQCGKPTFFDRMSKQFPGASFGNNVENINDESINVLYREMRDCMTVSAYTTVVLVARKLLMHIAASKGAGKNKKFAEYVKYLSDNNYIPPDAKGWVDHIRLKGNEANHQIIIMEESDAKDLISFIEMLLKIIYEFPQRIKIKDDGKKIRN